MRHELGFAPAAGSDALDALGEHFFPTVLEREGQPGGAASRRFAVDLDPSKTTAVMWNTPSGGPFHYQAIDATHGQLWARLPLRDAAAAARRGGRHPLAEFSVPGTGGGRTIVWREVHGPLSAFGPERDWHNAPVPCVAPSPALAELEQREPLFQRAEDVCPRHCGFESSTPGAAGGHTGLPWRSLGSGSVQLQAPAQYCRMPGYDGQSDGP